MVAAIVRIGVFARCRWRIHKKWRWMEYNGFCFRLCRAEIYIDNKSTYKFPPWAPTWDLIPVPPSPVTAIIMITFLITVTLVVSEKSKKQSIKASLWKQIIIIEIWIYFQKLMQIWCGQILVPKKVEQIYLLPPGPHLPLHAPPSPPVTPVYWHFCPRDI